MLLGVKPAQVSQVHTAACLPFGHGCAAGHTHSGCVGLMPATMGAMYATMYSETWENAPDSFASSGVFGLATASVGSPDW